MVAEMAADDIATKVRSDKIDILVDLGGHTASSRLDVMALCPAPILVTWMG
jgi:predicted O-linked N-acetylglucosamine transferase (SPINDLY family)